MTKIEINGFEATSFGTNNYSCNMEAIVFNHEKYTVKQVQALPNVFLHPTCKPNSLEIFALLGKKEDMDVFYTQCIESEMTKEAVKEMGGFPPIADTDSWDKLNGIKEDKVYDFIPWYTYYPETVKSPKSF